MPFALLIIGTLFTVAGVRETDGELFELLKGDIFNTGDYADKNSVSFISWLIAILVIGSLGYVESFKPISRAFIVLLIVVLFLSNGGFFQKFMQAVKADNSPAGTIQDSPVLTLPAGGIKLF